MKKLLTVAILLSSFVLTGCGEVQKPVSRDSDMIRKDQGIKAAKGLAETVKIKGLERDSLLESIGQ